MGVGGTMLSMLAISLFGLVGVALYIAVENQKSFDSLREDVTGLAKVSADFATSAEEDMSSIKQDVTALQGATATSQTAVTALSGAVLAQNETLASHTSNIAEIEGAGFVTADYLDDRNFLYEVDPQAPIYITTGLLKQQAGAQGFFTAQELGDQGVPRVGLRQTGGDSQGLLEWDDAYKGVSVRAAITSADPEYTEPSDPLHRQARISGSGISWSHGDPSGGVISELRVTPGGPMQYCTATPGEQEVCNQVLIAGPTGDPVYEYTVIDTL